MSGYYLAVASAIVFVVLFLVSAAIVIWFRWTGLSMKHVSALRQMVRQKTVQPLHDVTRGRVTVRGAVKHATAVLKAPLSGDPVVGYRVIVERRDGPNYWSQVVDQTQVVDFKLEEDGAVAIVEGHRAMLVLSQAVTEKRTSDNVIPQLVQDLLNSFCQVAPEPHQAYRFRWIELTLVEGERVYVTGKAFVTPASDGCQRSGSGVYRSTPTELRICSSDGRSVVVSDQDNKGVLRLLARPGGAVLVPRV